MMQEEFIDAVKQQTRINEEQRSAQKQNVSQMEKIEEVEEYNLQDNADYDGGNPFAEAMADSDEFYKQEDHEDDNQPVENAYDPFQPIEDGAASDADHFQTKATERSDRQDTV